MFGSAEKATVTIVLSLLMFFLHPGLSQSQSQTSFKVQENEDREHWERIARRTLEKNVEFRPNIGIAKNILFFIGDGMSIPTVAASRIYKRQKKGFSGEEGFLSFEEFPNVALAKTYNVDKQVPDSAGTSSAFLCGVKGNYATLGLTSDVKFEDCQANENSSFHLSSILEWAQKAGKSTGFVTNTRISHATPAGLYANSASRNWEDDADMQKWKHNCSVKDIARQLIEDEPGKNIQVILGGGRSKFLSTGTRTDKRDLIADWIKDKNARKETHAYVKNARELLNVDSSKIKYLLGLFSEDHMEYELERKPNSEEPTLQMMVTSALSILQRNPNGFFLFVEGGKIDMAHHDNMAKRALEETLMFDQSVAAAQQMTSPDDTIILVSADHSHVFTFNGYPARGNDILGFAGSSEEPEPHINYTTLMYMNGPGYRKTGFNISGQDTKANDFKQISALPLESETHAGDDVAVYVTGPRSGVFRGVIEQNFIPYGLAYAACIGPAADMCRIQLKNGCLEQLSSALSIILLSLILLFWQNRT